MTTTAPTGLPDFEGLLVVKSTAKVTNTGDGLSESRDLEPVPLHLGDEVWYIGRGFVTQVNHRPTNPEFPAAAQIRQQTIKTAELMLVEAHEVSKLMADRNERRAVQKEEAQRIADAAIGQERMDVQAEQLAAEQAAMEAEKAEAADDRPAGNVAPIRRPRRSGKPPIAE